MNIERLNEIAEWLEAGAPHKGKVHAFYMGGFIRPVYDVTGKSSDYNSCGTACCIAGAAVQFNLKKNKKAQIESEQADLEERAAKLLDMSYEDAEELFFGGDYRLSDITAKWAARCIRKYIKTGKIDWKGTCRNRYIKPQY